MPPRKIKQAEDQILQKRKKRSYEAMLEELASGDLLPSELHKLTEHFGKKMNNGIDIGYLKTVLFPEQYSYDIPFPLTSVSFCKFTDKQEMIISTGADGAGMLVWYPRTTCGPQVFVYNQVPSAPTAITPSTTKPGPWVKSHQYFTQAALVAAAITIQYVGKVENEAGLMVGGHLYGLQPEQITADEIENSQWVTRCRPGEGLRFVHLPRDATDFEFYQTAGEVSTENTYSSTNQGANKTGTAVNTTNEFMEFSFKGDTVNNKWYQPSVKAPAYIAGDGFQLTGSYLRYQKTANCIAIYWVGMEKNADWLRIDIARKFDGIPLSKYRDIMELTRPVKQFDERKTFNVLNTLCQSAPIGGHTLKEVDRMVDRIASALPNVSYLMDNGGIRQVNTLNELADILEHPLEEEKNLQGAVTGEIGRIYHYF